jgi:hypothetical protein
MISGIASSAWNSVHVAPAVSLKPCTLHGAGSTSGHLPAGSMGAFRLNSASISSVAPISTVSSDSKLITLLSDTRVRMIQAGAYMMICVVAMTMLILVLILAGINVQYYSPEALVIVSLIATADQLVSLCEMRILSVAIQRKSE